MLAVIWEYRERIWRTLAGLFTDSVAQRFAVNVAVAFLPAMVLGVVASAAIKRHLFHPVPVAIAFVLGAFVILWVEGARKRKEGEAGAQVDSGARVQSVDQMSWVDALKVGVAQCFALIPGTSRSGATIIGGMISGLSRRVATEFSFYLAIPTLLAAGAYSLYKERESLSSADVPVFLVGTVVSFLFALVCIRWLIRYVSRHDLTVFAWYRIAFGILVLVTAYARLVSWR